MMKKEMTIDSLAILMQREFLEFRKEILVFRKETKDGFAALTKRMDNHEERLSVLEQRVTRLEEDGALLRRDMEAGFQDIRFMIKQLRADIDALDYGQEVRDLKVRVIRLEKRAGIARI